MPDKYRVYAGIAVPEQSLKDWYHTLAELSPHSVLRQPHITLVFIGDVTLDQVQALHDSLGKIRLPRFSVNLRASGHFSVKNKHIVWAGAEPDSALLELQQQIREQIKSVVDIKSNRSFIPHISLLRHHTFTDAQLKTFHGSFAGHQSKFKVTSFGLYRSVLSANGVNYQLLHGYSLL